MIKTFLSAVALTAALATSTLAATVNFTATGSGGLQAGFGTDIGAATWLVDPDVVDGSLSGNYRSPYDQLGAAGTEYFTVGSPGLQTSPAIMALNAARTSFKMLWGSVDTYNAVEFCLGSTCVRITGSQIAAAAPANFGTGNAIVQFIAKDFAFDRISFFSNNGRVGDQPAFEFAVAAVPLPAGGLLLLGALGGIAALRRRRSV